MCLKIFWRIKVGEIRQFSTGSSKLDSSDKVPSIDKTLAGYPTKLLDRQDFFRIHRVMFNPSKSTVANGLKLNFHIQHVSHSDKVLITARICTIRWKSFNMTTSAREQFSS